MTSQATVTELFEVSRKFSPMSPQAVELNKLTTLPKTPNLSTL